MLKTIFACAAFAVLGTTMAAAQQPSAGPAPLPPTTTAPTPANQVAPPAARPEAHALTASDLKAFFDGMAPYAIHRDDIAGATFAVVKDGQIIFSQGYGYADLKTRKPVVADETMFRPGSV